MTESLDALQSISEHSSLKKHIQHLWFNPDCATSHGVLSNDALNTMQNKYALDHRSLLHTARLAQRLRSILINLPALKTLGMRRGPEYKAYGWRTIRDQTGQDPRVLGSIHGRPLPQPTEATLLFAAIINATAQSNIKIQRLYTDAIQLDLIPETLLPLTSIQEALKTVHYLEINIIGGYRTHSDSDQDAHDEYGARVVQMLRAIPELFELGMTIFSDPSQRYKLRPPMSVA